MKKFEYIANPGPGVSQLGKEEEKKYLNKMGLDGWELVCIVDLSFGNSHMYYWKREI